MKKIILLAAAAITLAACSNDDNYYVEDPVEAQFSATIGNGVPTRASGTSWEKGDEIGISMSDRYFNMKYATNSGDGNFEGSPIYFKNKREPVTLTAYYPFAGTQGVALNSIEASTSAEFQTDGKQPEIDFLFARNENVSGENPKVKFNFSHQMSQLTLIFKNGSGADVNKISSYTIEGAILDGTFNLSDGVCSAKPDGEAKSLIIDLTDVEVISEKELDPIILFPQAMTGKTLTLKIKDNEGQDYACSLNLENDRLEPGYNYKWTVTVNKTALSVDKSEIVNWITKSSEAGASSAEESEE
ncbi:MAG: fimbrillin family protein [Muribaculaceae bacterium]|nr:fimbrillin family protein [Muribaculaceae bacterium]